MNINPESLGSVKKEERLQQFLIEKFELPINAKNVTVYSQQARKENGMLFKGEVTWEMPEEKLVFNPLTGQDELQLIMNPCSRDLGLSQANWVTEEMRLLLA